MSFFKRPLFYSAILVALALGVFQTLAPQPIPKTNEVLYFTSHSKDKIFLGGQIISQVETRPGSYGGQNASFILKTARLWENLEDDGRDIKGKVRVVFDDPKQTFMYGDLVVLEGDLDPIPSVRNPGGFDAKRYWQRQGVTASYKVKKNAVFKILARDKGSRLKSKTIAVKERLSRALSRDFDPQNAAFLKALFLGERSELDEDFKDLFIRTGTMHLLAVSGFNLGFLFAVLWLLLKLIPLSRDPKLIFILISLWLYAALVGWQAPVMRATIMATAVIVARIIGRRADTLNLLGLAALIILAVRPGDVLDIGFQLSFLAVWGMAAFTPVFIQHPALLPHEKLDWIEKTTRGVQELFWISFICLFATLPVTVQNFFIITPWSLVTNILVVPLSFLIFFVGMIYFFTLPLIPGDWLVVQALKILMAVFIQILNFFERIPGAVLIVGKLHLILWCVLIVGLFYLFMTQRFKSRLQRALAIVAFAAFVFTAQEALRLHRPNLVFTMLDVGQGDSLFIEFPKKGYWLVDAGGSLPDQGRKVIAPFLKSKGIRRLDTIVYSHPQEDHIGGFLSVMDEFRVERILSNGRPYTSSLYRSFWEKAQDKKIKSDVVGSTDEIGTFPETRIRILHPPKDASPSVNVNEDSLVIQVQHGENRFLLTGDIEDKGLEKLLIEQNDLRSDVLKFPHHGGKVGLEGTRLIQACQPQWVLMSLGAKNPFGHPHPSALEAVKPLPEDRFLRTDHEGAVRLESDGKRIWRA